MENSQETKLCEYCRVKIPKKAKICPNCKKTQGGELKWIIVAIVAFGIIIGITGNSEGNKEQTQEKQSIEERKSAVKPVEKEDDISSDGIIDIDISKYHVKYLYHEIVENMVGEKCVAIYYEFTNNNDEPKAFDYTVNDKAFQSGIELKRSSFHVNSESKDRTLEVKSGVTITVCSGFVLRDEETDVELEVDKWISFSSKPKDSMVLSIK